MRHNNGMTKTICFAHRRPDPETELAVEGLPDSQAGAQRHRCAACAYELGVRVGIARATQRLQAIVAQVANGEHERTNDIHSEHERALGGSLGSYYRRG